MSAPSTTEPRLGWEGSEVLCVDVAERVGVGVEYRSAADFSFLQCEAKPSHYQCPWPCIRTPRPKPSMTIDTSSLAGTCGFPPRLPAARQAP